MTSEAVTVDARQLARILENLEPAAYQEAVGALLIDAAHVGEAETKKLTPRVTGHLRRSEQSDTAGARDWPNPHVRVASSNVPYAEYIETGERSDGVRLKTRPGGYRMFAGGGDAVEKAMPALLSKTAREIEAKWGAA